MIIAFSNWLNGGGDEANWDNGDDTTRERRETPLKRMLLVTEDVIRPRAGGGQAVSSSF